MGALDHVKLTLVEGMDDIRAFHEWLQKPRRVLGVDTETTGLSPEQDRVRLIQFGDLDEGWAMSWADYRGIALEALDRYDQELVLHNSMFDVRQISSNSERSVVDWPWHRTHDTMGLAHIADPQRPKGLKPLAARHVDTSAVSGQRALDDGMAKHGWTWESVPIGFPPYWQYAALDPVLTAYLFREYEWVIERSPRLYDLEMGSIRVAAKMEEAGMRVDLGYADSKARELRGYADAARRWLQDEHGLDNPTPRKLVKFFEENGVPLIDKRTDSGYQAMDKDVLKAVQHPVAQVVLNLRKAEKLAGSYLENFGPMSDSRGYVHPDIKTMGARTGRMSITGPALQTLPRKDPTVRNAFLASDADHVLVSCDYDQIEARLTAHFAQDPGLVAAFGGEDDFFCTIAGQVFQDTVTKSDPRRQLVKGVVYGKIYGASVAKMAATASVDSAVMREVNARFDTMFREVPHMMKRVVDDAKRRKVTEGVGYVTTPFGRRLPTDAGKEYTAVNYLIQCHASEVLKQKMVELDAALPSGTTMLLPIHDEVIFDVPKEQVAELREVIEQTMTATDYAVPITASSEVMPHRWGDKYQACPQHPGETVADHWEENLVA